MQTIVSKVKRRGRGRPPLPAGSRKTLKVQVNVSPAMKRAINDLAELKGLSASELMLVALAEFANVRLTPEHDSEEASRTWKLHKVAKEHEQIAERALSAAEYWRAQYMALAESIKTKGGPCRTTSPRPRPRPSKASQTRPAVN